MNENGAIRPAEAAERENGEKLKLNEAELSRVTGGQDEFDFMSSSSLKNSAQTTLTNATTNFYCKTCGFITMHKRTSDGDWVCTFCGSKKENS